MTDLHLPAANFADMPSLKNHTSVIYQVMNLHTSHPHQTMFVHQNRVYLHLNELLEHLADASADPMIVKIDAQKTHLCTLGHDRKYHSPSNHQHAAATDKATTAVQQTFQKHLLHCGIHSAHLWQHAFGIANAPLIANHFNDVEALEFDKNTENYTQNAHKHTPTDELTVSSTLTQLHPWFSVHQGVLKLHALPTPTRQPASQIHVASMHVVTQAQLYTAMQHAHTLGATMHLLANQCNPNIALAHGDLAERMGLSRDLPEYEAASVYQILNTALALGIKTIYLYDISSEQSIICIKQAIDAGLNVITSVDIHHLMFNHLDIQEYNTTYKFTPPLRSTRHQHALLNGLQSGIIQHIHSGHMDCFAHSKQQTFKQAAFGAASGAFFIPAVASLSALYPTSGQHNRDSTATDCAFLQRLAHVGVRPFECVATSSANQTAYYHNGGYMLVGLHESIREVRDALMHDTQHHDYDYDHKRGYASNNQTQGVSPLRQYEQHFTHHILPLI